MTAGGALRHGAERRGSSGYHPLLPWPVRRGEDSQVPTSGASGHGRARHACAATPGWAACWLALALAACGPLRYVSGVSGDASDAVEEARQAKAETLAPYWWTRAVEYLARARHEAAEADWQAANRFGRLAREAAETAVKEAAAAASDPSRRLLIEPAVAPAKDGEPAQERPAPAKERSPAAPAKDSSLTPARRGGARLAAYADGARAVGAGGR